MTRSVFARPAFALLLVVGSLAVAHDEDWRKLNTAPPYAGPAFVNGQWVNADGSPAPAPANPTDNQGVTLLAQIPLAMFPGGHTNASDCWGYTSPSGREYALIGLQKGFGVVEVTNPGAPVIVGSISGATSLWHDIKVIGDYAYGVSEGGLGVQVIDLTKVDNGVVTLVQNKQQGGHSSTHNIAANTESGYLYLCGANIANGGLVALSTANPTDPIIAGSWTNSYVHDAQVVSFTSGPYAGREIAYCCDEDTVDIVDVTNKGAMFTTGVATHPGAGYVHQGWLSADRKYFYVNDEADEGSGTQTRSRIYNVEDINNPFYVGEYTSSEVAIDHNNYWHNGFIFQANYTSGLQVFEATNPTNPVRVAWYDTSASAGASFNGAWSCYPYFPSGTVIVSDMQGGLFVLDVDVIGSGVLVIGINTPPTKLQPNTPTQITATIDEVNTTIQSGTVMLNYSVNGGAVMQTAMTLASGTTYEAMLPGMPCFAEVDYFVTAESVVPKTYQSGTTSALVFTGSQVSTVLDQSFEGGLPSGWTATGLWNVTSACEPGPSCSPQNHAYFGLPGSCNFNNGSAVTGSLSVPLDLTASAGTNVTLEYCYAREDEGGGSYDFAEVRFNGVAFEPNPPQSPNAFTSRSVDMSAFAGQQGTLEFFYDSVDSVLNDTLGWMVDGVKVIGATPTCDSCYADCDGSGSLDFFDFLCFQNEFANASSFADCDGSGTLDFFDFLCFQNAFAAGCP